MTPNNFRIKNGLTVSNGVTISAGNVVITSGQLVIGATAINATSLSDGANNAYSNAIAIAANASNLTSGTVAIARIPTADSVSNTSISHVPTANNVKTAYDAAIAANTLANTAATSAGAAYTNAVSYTDGKILTSNSAITGNAATAYTNATIFAANASNANNGTLAEARLPHRMNQDVRTSDSPTFANGSFTGDVSVGGSLTITGNLISQNVQSLAVADPLIKLGVNNSSDVLWGGFTFHYSGSGNTTNHAGLVRSPTSKEFLLMSTLGDETNVFNNNVINIADPSFSYANLTVNILKAGNSTVFSTINTTSFSGVSGFFTETVNAASYTVGSSFIANTTGAFHTGTVNAASHTTTGVTINATAIVPTSNSSGQTLGNTTSRFVLSANSIDTTGAINIAAGQVLKFNNDVGISRSSAAVLSIGNGTQNDSTGTISLTGGLFQGAVNAASHTVGSSFIANSTGITTTGFANVTTTMQVGGITTLAANLVMANNNITRPILTGYTEHEIANTAATGSYSLDCGAANFFDLTLTGNITIAPTNIPPATRVWSGSIAAKQDATGGRTITWPAGTKYAGGVSPPATTTANALDIWSIMTYDGGTTYIVSLSVKGAA
jgi:hypothetical protein